METLISLQCVDVVFSGRVAPSSELRWIVESAYEMEFTGPCEIWIKILDIFCDW